MPEAIKINGLSEFVRNLRKLDGELPKALRVSLNQAAQIVVDDARPRVPSRSGRARRSVRVASTRDRVRVRGGGARAPYYPWLDFGGRINPTGRFVIERPFYADGRYIYEAFYRRRDEFDTVLTNNLLDAASSAGIEVG